MQLTILNTRDFEIMLKIVPIDGIGLPCVMQLFYANQSIRNVRDISNALIGIE
jgi:hypothetical protein